MIEAVKENGYALQFIEQEFRTPYIMYEPEPVKRNPDAIKFIVIVLF